MIATTLKKLALIMMGAASIGFGAGEIARAATIVSGTISDNDAGQVTIDYWKFDVKNAGLVTIDVLSRDVLGSRLDSVLRLYNFDANGSLKKLGSLVAFNDDGYRPGYTDGSTSFADSFLSVNLGIGQYILGISENGFDESEARSGINQDDFNGTFAKYRITFTGDVTDVKLEDGKTVPEPTSGVQVEDGKTVPEPTSGLSLLALGALGAGSALKRKKGDS